MSEIRALQKTRWRLKPTERRVMLMTGDLLVSIFALLAAMYFWGQRDWLNFSWEFLSVRIPAWFYLLPLVWIFLLIELYDVRRAGRRSDTLAGVAIAFGLSLALYMVAFFVSEPNSLPRRGVAIFIVTAALLTILWRLIYISIFTAPVFMRRVVVIGAGRAGSNLVKMTKSIWPPPFYLVGLLDDNPEKIGQEIEGFPVLAPAKDLMRLVEQEKITDIIFAISGEMNPETFQVLLEAEEKGIEVSTMAKVYEELLGRVPIFLLQSDWVLRSFVDEAHTSGLYELGKRLLDILGGLIGVGILILLLPIICIAILIDSGRPIFFTQKRVGRNGEIYNMIKFRTMRNQPKGEARLTVDHDDRITRVGKFLRKSHLDEWPQFINILRGDMSLVGPRAEQPDLVLKFQEHIPFYRARLFVQPGLSGWAQVNMGYPSTIEETAVKLEYDLYYIKHRNLLLDFSIMVRTISSVIGFRGL
jgi:exopolysaccharide biosynthesis polyprenyl glycosylphosphotransferase